MNSGILPGECDWDNFWKRDQTKKFVKESYSKKRIKNVLSRYLGKGKKVLDAGCGSGFFSNYFCDEGMDASSLDYSDAALDIVREMTGGRSKVIKDDLLCPELPGRINNKFGLIFSDGLFEHFSKECQDKIMGNFISLLEEGGVIITFVPNRWSPWQLVRPFFMPGIKESPFVLGELIDLSLRNGLKIVSDGGINTFPAAFSPDRITGKIFGMLLFTVAKKLSSAMTARNNHTVCNP